MKTFDEFWYDPSGVMLRIRGDWAKVSRSHLGLISKNTQIKSINGNDGALNIHSTDGMLIVVVEDQGLKYWAYIDAAIVISQEKATASAMLNGKEWYSVDDICSLIGVPLPRFREWVVTDNEKIKFPDPDIHVVVFPLWKKATLLKWLTENIKLP